MSTYLLRDLDPDLIADYRAAAKSSGRSLQAELHAGLARGRPRRRLSRDELAELSQELRSRTPASAQTDSTAYLRWARDTDGGRYLGHGADDAADR